MQKTNILLLFLLYSTISWGQSTNQLDFIGLLKLKNSDQTGYTYKITFTVNNDSIQGYSYSGIGTPDETQSEIRGYILEDKIYFEETKITLAPDGIKDFCHMHVEAKIDPSGNNLQGTFKGFVNGDTKRSCGKGIVILSSKQNILKQLEKNNINEVPEVQKEEINIETATSLKDNIVLKKDETVNYYTQDDNISIYVFDRDDVDGDQVSFIFNNQKILDNYRLTDLHYEIPLTLNQETNKLQIIATSEGFMPPNTAGILIKDSKRTQPFNINLEENEQSEIQIIKIK